MFLSRCHGQSKRPRPINHKPMRFLTLLFGSRARGFARFRTSGAAGESGAATARRSRLSMSPTMVKRVAFGVLGGGLGLVAVALASAIDDAPSDDAAPVTTPGPASAPAPTEETVQPLHIPTNPVSSLLRIATGERGGTYFTVGQAIASIFTHPQDAVHCRTAGRCGPKGLTAVVQTSDGSVRNVRAVAAGQVGSALAQSDVLENAFSGSGPFREGALTNVRVLAALYPETLHLIVRTDTGIRSISELGGRTLSIGVEGSGSHAVFQALEAVQKDDMPSFSAVMYDPYRAFEQLSEGGIDGFYLMGGAPIPMISTLVANGTGTLISPLSQDGIAAVARSDIWQPGAIQSAFYPGAGDDGSAAEVADSAGALPSLQVTALLVVSTDMPEERAYQLTQALWHSDNRQTLNKVHSQGRNITLDTAIYRGAVPLHPGAERYYRQVGVLETADHEPVDPSHPVLLHKPETEDGAGRTPTAPEAPTAPGSPEQFEDPDLHRDDHVQAPRHIFPSSGDTGQM